MVVIHEHAIPNWHYDYDGLYSVTWAWEIPPTHILASCQITGIGFVDGGYANVAFARIRIRQPDGSDRVETFPPITRYASTKAFQRLNVTNITWGVAGNRSACAIICDILVTGYGFTDSNKPRNMDFTQAGEILNVKSVYGIVVYEPTDGRVCHTHYVLISDGSYPPGASAFEKDAVAYAENSGYKPADLKVLHIPDLKLEDMNSKYRVDIEREVSIKVSGPDQDFRDILNRN